MTDHTADAPRIDTSPDGDGVILHLPEITYLDTQTWAVDIGLTPAGLAALRALLHDDDGPIRATDSGRKLIADLDTNTKPKRTKKPASAETPSALAALRALAALPQPVQPHSGHRRGIWSLGARNGYSARQTTFYALADAGYVKVHHGPHLSTRLEVTATGRRRLTA
ncbi:hypothetical protein EAO71_35120 [Streptomyces sp. ms191]|uniref:hypothetical protein n=1 Tax=Streptomyces sp. ms191 TaxID=1827978 RepID=UPI0011CDE52D|nr:hypothetical protein [Streptomyces sp. ms191]TXS16059.1 hypothetical protein EAO71_35120 [Streptomyces sp. ms191]